MHPFEQRVLEINTHVIACSSLLVGITPQDGVPFSPPRDVIKDLAWLWVELEEYRLSLRDTFASFAVVESAGVKETSFHKVVIAVVERMLIAIVEPLGNDAVDYIAGRPELATLLELIDKAYRHGIKPFVFCDQTEVDLLPQLIVEFEFAEMRHCSERLVLQSTAKTHTEEQQATTQTLDERLDAFSHDEDFSSVTINGETIVLTKSQSKFVKLLWTQAEKGFPAVPIERLRQMDLVAGDNPMTLFRSDHAMKKYLVKPLNEKERGKKEFIQLSFAESISRKKQMST